MSQRWRRIIWVNSRNTLTVARISRESYMDGEYVGIVDSSTYDGFGVGLYDSSDSSIDSLFADINGGSDTKSASYEGGSIFGNDYCIKKRLFRKTSTAA
eukprot:scaffold3932_cov87-Cyclotella_meneghiniana.AAC.2